MSPDDLDQMLRDCVRHALQTHKYQRPRTFDTQIRDRYFSSVADAIVRQVKLSWKLEPPNIIRKQAPAPSPSTPRTITGKG